MSPVSKNRIAERRRAKGWTQKQLAKDLGLHVVHLSRLENNDSGITMEKLRRIAQALGCKAGDLLPDADVTTLNYDIFIEGLLSSMGKAEVCIIQAKTLIAQASEGRPAQPVELTLKRKTRLIDGSQREPETCET